MQFAFFIILHCFHLLDEQLHRKFRWFLRGAQAILDASASLQDGRLVGARMVGREGEAAFEFFQTDQLDLRIKEAGGRLLVFRALFGHLENRLQAGWFDASGALVQIQFNNVLLRNVGAIYVGELARTANGSTIDAMEQRTGGVRTRSKRSSVRSRS